MDSKDVPFILSRCAREFAELTIPQPHYWSSHVHLEGMKVECVEEHHEEAESKGYKGTPCFLQWLWHQP